MSIKMIELFSGIGSQAKALKKTGVSFKIKYTCEWNIHSIVAYDLIHNNNKLHKLAQELNKEKLLEKLLKYNLSNDGKTKLSEKTLKNMHEDELRLIYSSILKTNNFVDVTTIKGIQIPNDLDILTYSFPCQDLSNVGAFHGYTNGIDRNANTRSGLLWEVERILKEMTENNINLPKFLLLENVPALLAEKHRKNFNEWQHFLKNIGYYNHIYKLDALNFGLPQHRERLLMISVFIGNNINLETKLDNYFKTNNLQTEEYLNKRLKRLKKFKKYSLKDILKTDYSNETYKQEALQCQPNDTKSRRNIWKDNPQLITEDGTIAEFTATLTTKQDRHPNSGNIALPKEYECFNNKKSKYRYLTPRECFLLMGFDEEDFQNIIDNNYKVNDKYNFFTRDNLIKMAGNSIPVNVLELVFRQILDIKKKFFL